MSQDKTNSFDLKAQFIGKKTPPIGNRGAWTPSDQPEASSPACFSTAGSGEVLKRFKLILSDGQTVSIPYALMPIISLKSQAELVLSTPDLHIEIKGRNLGKLEEYLGMDLIKWIKESPGLNIDNETEVFISKIHVQCDYLF